MFKSTFNPFKSIVLAENRYVSNSEYVEYTNQRLKQWYVNAKEDYGVIGSGEARIEGETFIVDYIENGVKKTWSLTMFDNRQAVRYYFDIWMSEG